MARFVNVKYSESDYSKLAALAERTGLTVTEFVRFASLHIADSNAERLAERVDEMTELLVVIAERIEGFDATRQPKHDAFKTPSTRGNWS